MVLTSFVYLSHGDCLYCKRPICIVQSSRGSKALDHATSEFRMSYWMSSDAIHKVADLSSVWYGAVWCSGADEEVPNRDNARQRFQLQVALPADNANGRTLHGCLRVGSRRADLILCC
jgi:hypothetical protein